MSKDSLPDWNKFYQSLNDKMALVSETLVVALKYHELDSKEQNIKAAADLGCGSGIDTFELLRRGWTVFAIDNNPKSITALNKNVVPYFKEQLNTILISFEHVDLPKVDIINASFSLPFCQPEFFPLLWDRIIDATNTQGYFCGHFFGIEDSWAKDKSMTFHSEYQVKSLFKNFTILHFAEVKKVGLTITGKIKFWHVFHIVAKKLC